MQRGLKVIIAGAGGAAHLPGMTAAITPLPVIGVPVDSRTVPERGWFASPAAWRILATEYAKLLVMRLRSVVEPW